MVSYLSEHLAYCSGENKSFKNTSSAVFWQTVSRMARPLLDPLLHCITDGDVDGIKQMFRDSCVQGYEQSLQRHHALCAAIRNQTMSKEDCADIVRLLTCNIEGFDPMFVAGRANKNIIQIAFEENRCDLLPLLLRETLLEGCKFAALMQRFKLAPDDALQIQAALQLPEDSTMPVSLHPLDLKACSDQLLSHESDVDASLQSVTDQGRHFHFLRYLMYCQFNAALLYRKSLDKIVAVTRNCAFDDATGAARLSELFPSVKERISCHGLVTEHTQTQGFALHGRHYSYTGALGHVLPPSDSTVLSWAEFKATDYEERLVVGSSMDLVVFAQFGSDINSFNASFHHEENEEDAEPQRVASIGMPGHEHAAGDDFTFACAGIQQLLQTWSEKLL